MYLIDVSRIDETRNTFTVEMDIFVSWQDAALSFDANEAGQERRVYSGAEVDALRQDNWRAQIYPTNPVDPVAVGGQKMVVQADGRVEYSARVETTLRSQLNYRRFPFDTQVLPIELESFPWNRDEVRLVEDAARTGYEGSTTMPEWTIVGVDVGNYESLRVRDVVPFSNLRYEITIERDSGFYLWKIFLTVIIIVALTWVVFWMSGEGLGRRAGVSSSGILTVIAYQFVTTSSLPKVSYLTVADKVMILSVVTIALTMVESIVVDGWTHTNLARKERVDRICRVLFPCAYLIALLVLGASNGVIG